MKKTSSRLLTLALALIMVASLVACVDGGSGTTNAGDDYYNKTGLRICDDPITISVTGSQGYTIDWESTYLVQYVEQELGIVMDCNPFQGSAAASTYTTMIASGDLPDLVVGVAYDKTQIQIDGEDGYWLNFADYLDLMPNLKKMLEDYPDFAKYVTNPDGSIYSLTRVSPDNNKRGQIYYEKAVLEAAGWNGEIKTITDFENALRAVKNNHPNNKDADKTNDITPIAITFDAMPAYNADIILRTAFGILFGDNHYMLIEDANGNIQLGDISDNFKAYLRWMNKLYTEGLLEVYMDGRDPYRADVKEGKFAFWSDTGLGITDVTDYRNYGVIAALKHEPYTTESHYMVNTGLTNAAKVFVNANTAYPEAICRLIDYFCGEEGKYMAVYGKEGVHFNIETDQFGLKVLENASFALAAGFTTAAGKGDTTSFLNTVVCPNQIFAMHHGFFQSGLTEVTDAQLDTIINAPVSQDNPNQWNAIKEKAFREIDDVQVRLDQVLGYTEDENLVGATLRAGLKNYLKTQKVSFIQKGITDAEWDAYVAQVKAMGWDTLQPIEQAAWNRAWG